MTEHNLPEPDDAPWLNLTPQEVEELRYNKQKLTNYGREKLRTLIKLAQEHSNPPVDAL
jgi:hypothetical protein